MLRKMALVSLAIISVLAGNPASTPAVTPVTVANTSQKGSLLIFPKIVTADGPVSGTPALNTVIYLGNDNGTDVSVKCFWVSDSQTLASFQVILKGNQQIAVSAYDNEFGDSFPPNPSGNTSGQLLCWAVKNQYNTAQKRHNHLYGNALIQYLPPECTTAECTQSNDPTTKPSAVSYNAWSYRALKKSFGTPGKLKLDGDNYDASPKYLVANYTPGESLAAGLPSLQADLALALCRQDLRNARTPVCTKAKFKVVSANQTVQSGAYQCINTWSGALLEEMGSAGDGSSSGGSAFKNSTHHGLPGRFSVEAGTGSGDTQCLGKLGCPAEGKVAVPFVGVMLYESIVAEAPYRIPYAVFALQGVGDDRTGVIQYDVPPVAVTNGPWPALPGLEITFDGSGSYSPGGDGIVSYEWDLDGDGLFNEPGDDGAPVGPVGKEYSVVKKTFLADPPAAVTLKVTDSKGLVGMSIAENSFVSISLVYVEGYKKAYQEPPTGNPEYLGIRFQFKNQGDADLTDIVATLTKAPDNNFTIKNGEVSLGRLAKFDATDEKCLYQKWSQAKKKPLTGIRLKLNKGETELKGPWQWKVTFKFNNSSYTINELPAYTP